MLLFRLFALLLVLPLGSQAQSGEKYPSHDDNTPVKEQPLPLEKWSPRPRILPQDHPNQLPCDQVGQVKPTSEQHRRDLQARRQQCLQKYRAFTPGDGVR